MQVENYLHFVSKREGEYISFYGKIIICKELNKIKILRYLGELK